MMLDLVECPEGTILPVRAQAGARVNEIRGVQDGVLKVAVTQVAEKGKANQAIRQLLSRRLGIGKSRIELVQGAASPRKTFLLHGIRPSEVRAGLRKDLGPETK